jgi:transposase
MADLYGVSSATIYRALSELHKPKSTSRADFGRPRKMAESEMQLYCEIVAAMKLRTTNKQGRHLSTSRASTFWRNTELRLLKGIFRRLQVYSPE